METLELEEKAKQLWEKIWFNYYCDPYDDYEKMVQANIALILQAFMEVRQAEIERLV